MFKYISLFSANNSFSLQKQFSPRSLKCYLNQAFSKNLQKYVQTNSFLEPVALLKMNYYWGIFQEFCLKVSEDLFYRTPPRIFVLIVNRLCTVFLRYPELC